MAKNTKKPRHLPGLPRKSKPVSNQTGVVYAERLLPQALALQQAGNLQQAEALYRQILAAEPTHPEALHFLGMLAHQVGQSAIALELISKSLDSRPDYTEAAYNLGFVLLTQGRNNEAVTTYQRLLTLKPGYVKAYNNLGNALLALGKLDEAFASFRQALTLKPDYLEAHINLGITLKAQGKLNEAIGSFRQALALKPDYVEALYNLGLTYQEQGKLDEAVASYRRALAIKSDHAKTQNNLGSTLKAQGKLDEALASFRRLLALTPNSAEAYYNLGLTLHEQGKLDEAVASFRQALTLKPDYAVAHNSLGFTLRSQGKPVEAIASFRQALTLKPDSAETYSNLAGALLDQGRMNEAVDCFRHSLALKPDFIEAHNNLAGALLDQGRMDEAVAGFRRAIAVEPDNFEVHSNLLFCFNYLTNQSHADYLDEARQFGLKATKKVTQRFSTWTCPAKPDCLRIGLLSGDLRNHPVGFFLENFLSHMESSNIKLVAYPSNNLEDELTARIRSRFVAWKPLAGLEDEASARLIHDDGVHILLDLSGHTDHNRLPVFAWKPAPIQATWLGYFASTGIAEMDYLLADPMSVPDFHREHFTEKIWYLPETRLCFSPPVAGDESAATPLPALRNGYVTFACFQKATKINDLVLAAWGKILQALPNARLRLQNKLFNYPTIREQLLERLARNGITSERVTLAGSVPRLDYLAAHAHIDIILDTFPFPGGTTTCEALWMEVPTVTIAGDTMLARQGSSLLACAGMNDWIATDVEDYVAKVVAHATDLEKLAALRAGLRRQVLASPLFDGARFACHFEEAMWGMWHSYSAG